MMHDVERLNKISLENDTTLLVVGITRQKSWKNCLFLIVIGVKIERRQGNEKRCGGL